MFLAEITWFHILFPNRLIFLFHSYNLYAHSPSLGFLLINDSHKNPPTHPLLKTVKSHLPVFITIYRSSNLTITKTHPPTSLIYPSPRQQSPTPTQYRKKKYPDTHLAAPFHRLPTSYPVLKEHAKFNNEHRKCLYTEKTPLKMFFFSSSSHNGGHGHKTRFQWQQIIVILLHFLILIFFFSADRGRV